MKIIGGRQGSDCPGSLCGAEARLPWLDNPHDPNSASSQFFICLKRMSGWDRPARKFVLRKVRIEHRPNGDSSSK